MATELGLELARRGHEVHFITYAQPFRLASFVENVYYHEVDIPSYPLFDHPPYTLALTVAMPPEPNWDAQVGQQAFQKVMGLSPRVALAGLLGYFWGEFANSYVLARMKVWQQGRHLWMRTIGSTIVGQLVDTLLFCLVAFWGILDPATILRYTVTGYFYKSLVEIVMTPLTYRVVSFLKRVEGCDVYDRDTDFNPFAWSRQA